jgi:hypothetical protein
MIVRLYTGGDGESHFEEVTPAFAWEGKVERAPLENSKGVIFNRHPVGHFMDWHNAPRRQYVIMLSGQMEIQVGDGTVKRFGAGDVLLAEDLTGRGHTTRVVGDAPRLSATVRLA